MSLSGKTMAAIMESMVGYCRRPRESGSAMKAHGPESAVKWKRPLLSAQPSKMASLKALNMGTTGGLSEVPSWAPSWAMPKATVTLFRRSWTPFGIAGAGSGRSLPHSEGPADWPDLRLTEPASSPSKRPSLAATERMSSSGSASTC